MSTASVQSIMEELKEFVGLLPVGHMDADSAPLHGNENKRALDVFQQRMAEAAQASVRTRSGAVLAGDVSVHLASGLDEADNAPDQHLSRLTKDKMLLQDALAAKRERVEAMNRARSGEENALAPVLEREYDVAMRRAAGKKVRDDPQRIKRSLNRELSSKRRSAQGLARKGRDADKPAPPQSSKPGFSTSKRTYR